MDTQNVVKTQENWKEEYERDYIYCDALLIQFRIPKVFDLRIPDPEDISSLVDLGIKKMLGRRVNPLEVNCLSTSNQEYSITKFNRIEKALNDQELSERIFKMIREEGTCEINFKNKSQKSIKNYLNHQRIFRMEWIFGHGTWYNYREGEKEKAELRVKRYIPLEHVRKINLLGESFQEYIGLTSRPCEIN